MKQNQTRKMILSSFFIALGLILPFITMQIPTIASQLCPMHIPVLLCGFVVGAPYGLIVGFITPLLRSVLFGMPAMFPSAFCMAFELAAYGFFAGTFYRLLKKSTINVYVSLIGAMICGRIVWACASIFAYSIQSSAFTYQMFIAGAFLNAIPGIILQLILIPVVVLSLKKARYIEA